jgi:O-antigen polymerase
MSVVEAGVGIFQYLYQYDLGLQLLGESHLSTQIAGVAKLDIAGLKFLRAYGTFLHPNVLAVFLALGLVIASYFYLRADKKLYLFNWRQSIGKNFDAFITNRYFYIRLVLIIAMSVLVFGLALTFSRSGWLAASLGICILAACSAGRGARPALRLGVALVCMVVAVSIVLQPFLINRISSQNYGASLSERVVYNGIGLAVAMSNPLTGVGIGSYVLSQSTRAFEFLGLTQPWQWQPAHNLVIAIAAETGVVGLLSFISLLVIVVIRLLRQQTEKSALALSLLAVLLTSAMFDHFFLTLEQGRLIFSLVLILALA